MMSVVRCKCGRCLVPKSDAEYFCCKDHELLADRSKTFICATDFFSNLEAYVSHKPSLEMVYIDGMIKRYSKGPAAEELSNR